MKGFLIIVIGFININLFGQKDLAFKELDTYLELNYLNFSYENLIQNDFKNFNIDPKFSSGLVIERERDWKVIEKIYVFEFQYWEGNKSFHNYINLYVYSQNNQNFLLVYGNDIFKDVPIIPKHFGNETKILSILNAHNLFYKIDLSVEQMINQLSSNVIYTYACGELAIAEKIPSYDSVLFGKKRNLDEYRSWLKSFNLEEQMFGYDALYYLQKHNNYQFSEKEKLILQNIKNRNSALLSCEGFEMGIFKKVF